MAKAPKLNKPYRCCSLQLAN